MWSNYWKIATRSLWRNKAFSAINIIGLAIGIATCLVIVLYVFNELGYDRYNKKASRMVRVVFKGTIQDQQMKEANVMPPTARILMKDYPEVQEATRLTFGGSPIIRYGEKSFKEDHFAYVDSNFFQVFTLPLLEGNAATALLEPNSIIITQSQQQKYFGKEPAIGKILEVKGWNTFFKVTGIIADLPAASHFHFDFFASMVSRPGATSDSWMDSGYYTYLVLPEGYDYKKLQAKLPQVVEKYMGPQLEKNMGVTLQQFRSKGNDIGLYLQPITDIHLHSDLNPSTELEAGGDVRYVYIFSAIGLFVLMIACINFMNLSTAGASKRSREVGIRKVLGSRRGELVRQFLFESVMITALALLLALVAVKMTLPVFSQFTGKNLSLEAGGSWLLPGLFLLVLVVGIVAGIYPAFFLSSFKPVSVLKGKFTAGRGSLGFRSGLVVFQFGIAMLLVIGTIVVYRQLAFIQNIRLGYNKNQVLVLPETWLLGKNEDAFRQQLLQDTRIENLTASSYLPAGPTNGNNFLVYKEDKAAMVKTMRYEVDCNYIPTLGMQMQTGRNFSPDFKTDSTAIVLNETAARVLGWNNNAIGHTLKRTESDNKVTEYHVIGVVKDFHFRSMHELIAPLVMTLNRNNGTTIIKVKSNDIAGLLNSIRKQWSAYKAEAPLAYTFLDDRFRETYEKEQKTGTLLGIFAGLTIFVACLGLFGLALFTSEQRTREIGIRKVLGASVGSIVSLLSRYFLKLVLIANVIAWPIAGWVMNQWLQDFAYRTAIQWWFFAVAGMIAVIIAIIAVSFQSVRAALSNPVDSLRSE